MEKVSDGSKILDKSASDFGGSVEVLRRSPGILPKYQEKVREHLTHGTKSALVPTGVTEFTYDLFESILKRLGDLYNWIEEESRGRRSDRLVPSTEPRYTKRIRYWARLMSYWVKGDPLVLVIRRTIAYHAERGTIEYIDYSRSHTPIEERFDPSSPKHINIIIEDMMKDLETGLRFKIISYLENYHDLCVARYSVRREPVSTLQSLLNMVPLIRR